MKIDIEAVSGDAVVELARARMHASFSAVSHQSEQWRSWYSTKVQPVSPVRSFSE